MVHEQEKKQSLSRRKMRPVFPRQGLIQIHSIDILSFKELNKSIDRSIYLFLSAFLPRNENSPGEKTIVEVRIT